MTDPTTSEVDPQRSTRRGVSPAIAACRRWALILGIGLLGCVVAAGLRSGWWVSALLGDQGNDQPVQVTGSARASLSEQQKLEHRYGHSQVVTMAHLTPEVDQVLGQILGDPTDLATLTELQDEVLRAADPHLDRAIQDPFGTPFRPDEPRNWSVVFPTLLRMWDRIVDDYLEHTEDAPETAQPLAEAMRRVLHARQQQQAIPEDDLELLSQARQGGDVDPLVMLCLYRGSVSASAEERCNLLLSAYQGRQRREICDDLAAQISARLLSYNRFLETEAYTRVVVSVLADLPRVWGRYPSAEEHFAQQAHYFEVLLGAFGGLNAFGKVDLLLAMAEHDPEIHPWVLNALAARLLNRLGSVYRGGSYISEVERGNLELFQQAAERETNHLLRAWTLAPEHPWITNALMSIEMRAGATPLNIDHWFRHSMASGFFAGRATSIYNSSVMNRWGGSPARQLWLAEKYVETDDPDSGMPFQYIVPLNTTLMNTGYTASLGDHPTVRAITTQFVETLQLYSRTDPHPQMTDNCLSMTTLLLWQAEAMSELEWLLGVYGGDHRSCSHLHHYRLHLGDVYQIAKGVSRDRTRWMILQRVLFRDHRSVTPRQLAACRRAVDQLLEQDDAEEQTAVELLQRCARRVEMLQQLLDHEEIVLDDEQLAEWLMLGNAAEVAFPYLSDAVGDDREQPTDTSSRVVAATSQGAADETDRPGSGTMDMRLSVPKTFGAVLNPIAIDPPLRISMDVEVIKPAPDPHGISLLMGPPQIDASMAGFLGPALTLDVTHGQVITDRMPEMKRKEHAEAYRYGDAREPHTIAIEVFSDGYHTYLGDKQIGTTRAAVNTAGMVLIGRYLNFAYDLSEQDVKYRLSNVRLQKLRRRSVDDHPEDDFDI